MGAGLRAEQGAARRARRQSHKAQRYAPIPYHVQLRLLSRASICLLSQLIPSHPSCALPQKNMAASNGAGDRGGKRPFMRIRGGRRPRAGFGGRGGRADSGLVKLSIGVDSAGLATVAVRVLARRGREETPARAAAAPDAEERQQKREEEKKERREKKERERREREARRSDAAYSQARAAALAVVGVGDAKLNLQKALAAASKLVLEAQRKIEAKSARMAEIMPADEDEVAVGRV